MRRVYEHASGLDIAIVEEGDSDDLKLLNHPDWNLVDELVPTVSPAPDAG